MEDSYEAASTRDVRFRRWFPNKPRPAFRRGRTFREELVKARLPSGTGVRLRLAAREKREGVRRCKGAEHCPMPVLLHTDRDSGKCGKVCGGEW